MEKRNRQTLITMKTLYIFVVEIKNKFRMNARIENTVGIVPDFTTPDFGTPELTAFPVFGDDGGGTNGTCSYSLRRIITRRDRRFRRDETYGCKRNIITIKQK